MKKTTLLFSVLLFSLYTNAQCNAPSNIEITSDFSFFMLEWDDNGENTWDIEYGESGFSPTGTPTIEDLTSSYYDLYDLPQSILYDIYVRADCGATTSDWVGPFTFYNYCTSSSVYEGFNDEFIPICWEQANQGSPDTEPLGFGQGIWEQGNFANGQSNLSAKIHIQGIDVNDWLLTPLMQADIPIKEETFWIYTEFHIALTQHNSPDVATLGSDDQIQLVYSLDYGNTWQNLITWNNTNTISNTGETISDYITVSSDSYWLLMAFYVSSGIVSDTENIDFFIDNVNFQYQGSGSVTDLTTKGFEYYPNPSENFLNLRAKENIDQVVLYNSLGQVVKRVDINALNYQLDISYLPEAVYYMNVRIGDTVGVLPVVKN